jgi:hypothetical protein
MKTHFHFHFYIRVFILVILGVVFSVLITKANYPGGGLETRQSEMNGWAWSPNIGWVSLNCYNDFDGDGVLNNSCLSGGGIDYRLYLDTSNDETVRAVGGCAWAGNVGWWICFDDPDDDPVVQDGLLGVDAPDWGVYLNGPVGSQYYDGFAPAPTPSTILVQNSLSHSDNVAYHASIVPLEGVAGWSNELGFPISDDDLGSNSMEGCFNCQENIDYYCDADIAKPPCEDLIIPDPCIVLVGEGSTCLPVYSQECENCLEYTYDVDGNMADVIGGYNCSSCTLNGPNGVDTICPLNSYNNNQNACTCANSYSTPGLIVDYTTSTNDGYASMCGWAWNQFDCGVAPCNGVGWLQFSPRITSFNNPYFSVDKGNIYSKGNIRAEYALPPNAYNAYIIEAGGDIYQLFASSTLDGFQGNYPNGSLIDFPTLNGDNGHYSNILGNIDYDGLTTPLAASILGKYYNKYGLVVNINDGWGLQPSFWSGGPNPMNNEIFFYNSDLAGPNSDVVVPAVNNNNGAGIVIIEGDLDIMNNISYDNSGIGNLQEIPSLVWIVKGDVTIDPTVTEVSGTFIVLGDGAGDCSLPAPEAGCGQFISGSGGGQLIIYGSVLAKHFDLSRSYAADGEPAERFMNDGRLQINPPTGLEAFAQSIPKFDYSPQ